MGSGIMWEQDGWDQEEWDQKDMILSELSMFCLIFSYFSDDVNSKIMFWKWGLAPPTEVCLSRTNFTPLQVSNNGLRKLHPCK